MTLAGVKYSSICEIELIRAAAGRLSIFTVPIYLEILLSKIYRGVTSDDCNKDKHEDRSGFLKKEFWGVQID